ncbi:baculoviral IAP repeat-containing protein 3-like [Argopecten irradians]|uniref:baculoviral IAP repeat-containing protein 3-like n=1 Tax=Argopecten irradians TaxID=31199 RepID=UPI0037242E95
MSGSRSQDVKPKSYREKRSHNRPKVKRSMTHKMKFYPISSTNNICSGKYHTCISSTGTTGLTKFKLREANIESNNDVCPISEQVHELVGTLASCIGEAEGSDIGYSRTLHTEYLVTVTVIVCDVTITSWELVGFVCINEPKEPEYSYSFTVQDPVSEESSDQDLGSKANAAKSETIFRVIFRRYPDNCNCKSPISSGNSLCRSSPRRKDDVICRASSHKKRKHKFQKSSKSNVGLCTNEEVLAHVINVTLSDFSRGPNNYGPVELSTRACSVLRGFPYVMVNPKKFEMHENIQNESFMSSLLSFLTWPNDAALSPCDLVRAEFVRDNGMHLKCRSCGLVVDSEDLNCKDTISTHTQNGKRCMSLINDDLITLKEKQVYTKTDDKDNENIQESSVGAVDTAESTINDTPPRTKDVELLRMNPEENKASPSSESVSLGNDTNDIQSYSSNGAPEEAQTGIPTPSSDVTSDSGLLGTASGGSDTLYPPRHPRYTSPDSRRLSFRAWTGTHNNIDIIVDSGFFFTGEEDIVRCFHCDIGLAEWDPEDDPWVEHARHSPDCPFLRSRKDEQFINNIQLEWAQIYTPKHPHMDTVAKREESYTTSWPGDYVVQTPHQLALAGFFYTGETDTVRCHYCDGGLREWEPNDDPWTEHARWFPFCKFVIKIKGLQFIQNSAVPEDAPDGGNDVPQVYTQTPDFAPPTYADECKKRELKNPMFSAAAESILSVGYSKSTVKDVIMLYIERTGRRDFNSGDLMGIAFELEEEGKALFSEDIDIVTDEEEEFQLTPKAMTMENAYLKEMMICVKCKEKERSMLFISCGHRVTCETCSKDLTICPVCSTGITKALKTFLG